MADEKKAGETAGADLVKNAIRAIRASQRILYPGLAVALFLQYRYSLRVFEGFGTQQLPSLFLSLLLGTLIYFSYRGLVHPYIQSFQEESSVGIPQQGFHKHVCDELGLTGVIRDSLRFSQACLSYFQSAYKDQLKSPDSSLYNSGSHLLYMTGMIGFLLLLHDGFFFNWLSIHWKAPTLGDFIGWINLMLVGFVAGISYDRQADYREAIVLHQNAEKYKEILDKVKIAWPEGTRSVTRKDRIDYIKSLLCKIRLWLVLVPVIVVMVIVIVKIIL